VGGTGRADDAIMVRRAAPLVLVVLVGCGDSPPGAKSNPASPTPASTAKNATPATSAAVPVLLPDVEIVGPVAAGRIGGCADWAK
jgi:hypothetical protein